MKSFKNGDKQHKIFKIFRIMMTNCTIKNEKFYYRHRFLVSENDALRFQLIKQNHNLFSTGHENQTKVFTLLTKIFFFSNCVKFVKQYVRNCHICAKFKISNEKYNKLLKLMPVSNQKWKKFSINFVTRLPRIGNYNAMMIMMNRFIK